MRARIYKPARTAMQSGKARTKLWLLEYEPQSPRVPDPLMGWSSARDTLNQVQLRFDTLDEAVAQYSETFDRRHGGFGDAPKFPRPAELLFLLREHARTGAAARAPPLAPPRKNGEGNASRYWFFSDWFMISRASKLMPQVGKELPTKKLSPSLA